MQLSFRHMSKAYGGVPAVSDVTLDLRGGEIRALMGENGAGKSTLIKLIAGVTPADHMDAQLDDRAVSLQSPQQAAGLGIRTIHQELNIVPQVTVSENILLGQRLARRFGGFVHWPKVHEEAQAALARLGANHINPRALASDLSAGDRMLVKIAAALVSDPSRPARLYVLDEPTAALTGAEADVLFEVLHRLRSDGAAILYVSHRIDEVMALCDQITVLRDGCKVAEGPISETSKSGVIRAMTGRELRDAYPVREGAIGPASAVSLTDVRTRSLGRLNLALRQGEILGIGGLSGAGQSAFLRLFMGLEPVLQGEATIDGAALPRTPEEAWRRGVAYIPKERRSEGLMLARSIRMNAVLPHLGRYGLRAQTRAERRDADAASNGVRLKRDNIEQPVAELSGGNQQKVMFARALAGKPKLLLLDEPTRGVDVGAKYDIYSLVRRASAVGTSVVMTSSDLPELLGMCDRILVLQDGTQVDLIEAHTLNQADLLARYYPKGAA